MLILKERNPASLAGRVTDLQGRPVAGAKVKASRSSSKDVFSDATGSFELTRLTPGTNGITVSAEGFAPERVLVPVPQTNGPLEIQLKPGNLLRIRVIDETKSAVPEAFVALAEWRDRHALDWHAKTDPHGYVEWTGAPDDAMKFDVLKSGYFESRNNAVRAAAAEQIITLRRALTVLGNVIDEETGERIANFKVIPGYQEPDSRQWFRSDFGAFENGYYKYAFETWRPPFTVRIEAEGYEIAMSRPLSATPLEQHHDFALKRLDDKSAVKGTVFLPNGQPAIRADVAVGTLDFEIRLGRKRFYRQNDTFVTNVNDRGEFAFPPDRNAHTLVAIADEGFGKVRVTPGQPVRIDLQPWARIEGTVRVPNSGKHQRSVWLSHPGTWNYHGSIWLMDHRAEVNEAGEFVLEDVPPCEIRCILYDHKGHGGQNVSMIIPPGQTTQVQIGGHGNTVIGRLTPATTNAIHWSHSTAAYLSADLPPLQLGAADDPATMRRKADFWQSAEGLARSRAHQTHPVEIEADGAFRIYDVPPGAYRLVTIFSNASFVKNISIPDEPTVDLGVLVVR